MDNCTKNKGFTLIELMIVVVIVSILSIMAIPNFMNYQCKSKQGEARQSLGAVAKCEEAFKSEYDRYSTSPDSIGFTMKGTSRYSITITADRFSFTAKAAADGPGAPSGLKIGTGDDVWTIDQELKLENIENACTR